MTIQIDKNTLIKDIQKEFHTAFPFLKLAFFTKSHEAFEGNHAKNLISDKAAKVSDVNPSLKAGSIEVTEQMTVMKLEEALEKEYGLHVQVFRKSGNLYLETSVTDNLTLAEQTEKAKDAEYHEIPIADPMDYREQL